MKVIKEAVPPTKVIRVPVVEAIYLVLDGKNICTVVLPTLRSFEPSAGATQWQPLEPPHVAPRYRVTEIFPPHDSELTVPLTRYQAYDNVRWIGGGQAWRQPQQSPMLLAGLKFQGRQRSPSCKICRRTTIVYKLFAVAQQLHYSNNRKHFLTKRIQL